MPHRPATTAAAPPHTPDGRCHTSNETCPASVAGRGPLVVELPAELVLRLLYAAPEGDGEWLVDRTDLVTDDEAATRLVRCEPRERCAFWLTLDMDHGLDDEGERRLNLLGGASADLLALVLNAARAARVRR